MKVGGDEGMKVGDEEGMKVGLGGWEASFIMHVHLPPPPTVL